jgi:hypothetical protein
MLFPVTSAVSALVFCAALFSRFVIRASLVAVLSALSATSAIRAVLCATLFPCFVVWAGPITVLSAASIASATFAINSIPFAALFSRFVVWTGTIAVLSAASVTSAHSHAACIRITFPRSLAVGEAVSLLNTDSVCLCDGLILRCSGSATSLEPSALRACCSTDSLICAAAEALTALKLPQITPVTTSIAKPISRIDFIRFVFIRNYLLLGNKYDLVHHSLITLNTGRLFVQRQLCVFCVFFCQLAKKSDSSIIAGCRKRKSSAEMCHIEYSPTLLDVDHPVER